MKWSEMRKPLEQGFQAFRDEWPEDRYVEKTEGGKDQVFWENAGEFGVTYMEAAFEPSAEDLNATDWRATGPGGE